ncbi:MAG: DUF4304 domain-containing protein [Blastocatellia bacterium]|nr:DUF4304 domain-containing protein [Blastocatellia bacterium]
MNNAAFTKTILLGMHACLKPFGYRKRGQLFEYEMAEVVHLVGLQKSLSSSAQAIKVTVNLAIWLKSLAPIRAGIPEKPSIVGGHWHKRIGEFTSEKDDKWWWITTQADAQKTAREISDLLSAGALPDVNKIQSQLDLVRLWRKGICPGLTDFQRQHYLTKLDVH